MTRLLKKLVVDEQFTFFFMPPILKLKKGALHEAFRCADLETTCQKMAEIHLTEFTGDATLKVLQDYWRDFIRFRLIPQPTGIVFESRITIGLNYEHFAELPDLLKFYRRTHAYPSRN